jgi:hypothetical protein
MGDVCGSPGNCGEDLPSESVLQLQGIMRGVGLVDLLVATVNGIFISMVSPGGSSSAVPECSFSLQIPLPD